MAFRLRSQKMNPKAKSTRKEKHGVSDVLEYLDLLYRQRVPIAYWVNEEHPGHRGFSHKRRGLASDIIGIHGPSGRWIAIEMKREKEYAYIIGHWEKLKADKGRQCAGYDHFCTQIEFIEKIRKHGGIGLFAWRWEDVRDLFVSEGIDTTGMLYAGEGKQ